MLTIHNERMLDYIRPSYRRDDVERLYAFLEDAGTFRFHRLDNGLFPATSSATDHDTSGYQHAWVRDNVHIAHAHYVWGDIQSASQAANSLMRFFQGQRQRMQQVIQRPAMAADPMNRPHVRFNGRRIESLAQKWPHAQNDALGYFLWFFCKLAREHLVLCGEAELQTLADLVLYLQAIRYWMDRDSGHWEEARKVSASSIGTVVAGLREFAELCADRDLYSKSTLRTGGIYAGCVDDLLARGQNALRAILPYECRSPSEASQRQYDAALLFLIYPLQIVRDELASKILQDVKEALEGVIGIRRYLNDSYWCANYRSLFLASERTGDFSENMEARDAHIKLGEEAQWCIFDPIVSCIHGFSVSSDPDADPAEERRLQTYYLNRALGQLTAETASTMELQCPEAYFLENGEYVPNEHTPLQWTQANLRMALHWLKITTP